MGSDEISHMAWIIVAKQKLRGQKDPTMMVAEGILLERERWRSAGHIAVQVQDNQTSDEERLAHPRSPDSNCRN